MFYRKDRIGTFVGAQLHTAAALYFLLSSLL